MRSCFTKLIFIWNCLFLGHHYFCVKTLGHSRKKKNTICSLYYHLYDSYNTVKLSLHSVQLYLHNYVTTVSGKIFKWPLKRTCHLKLKHEPLSCIKIRILAWRVTSSFTFWDRCPFEDNKSTTSATTY